MSNTLTAPVPQPGIKKSSETNNSSIAAINSALVSSSTLKGGSTAILSTNDRSQTSELRSGSICSKTERHTSKEISDVKQSFEMSPAPNEFPPVSQSMTNFVNSNGKSMATQSIQGIQKGW